MVKCDMNTRPVIVVPACRRELDPHPFHMVGEKYLTALQDGAKVIPWILPAIADDQIIDEVISRIDGLFLTGSASNVEPHHYQGEESRPGTLHDPARDAVTLPLIHKILEARKPLFAVCRGLQELNVALGGTLHQHIDEVDGYHNHRENPSDPLEVQYGPSHEVTLSDSGLLKELFGKEKITVNSLHGQGIDTLAENVIVEAIADDGSIEGFRVDQFDSFVLAVQWHPEWRVMEDEYSLSMFTAFGNACRKSVKSR